MHHEGPGAVEFVFPGIDIAAQGTRLEYFVLAAEILLFVPNEEAGASTQTLFVCVTI